MSRNFSTVDVACIFLNFSTSKACKNVLGRPRHMFKVFTMLYKISAFEYTNFRDRTTCRSKFKADLRDIFMILLLWTLLAEKPHDVNDIAIVFFPKNQIVLVRYTFSYNTLVMTKRKP